MSNTVSTDCSRNPSLYLIGRARGNGARNYGFPGTATGISCLLFFLGILFFCSCAGPRFPAASQSAKDPYAENGPKTREEEAYYHDVYSGEWREQVGPFGFAKSIGKKSGSKTMPPHWAMMPHGAKTMNEIKAETAMRQADRLAYNSNYRAPMPGAPGMMPGYYPAPNPVSPASFAQAPYPAGAGVPNGFPPDMMPPVQNGAPYYTTPTYHGQGQYVPAVVERPVSTEPAIRSNLPPYSISPQSGQNPPYSQPNASVSQAYQASTQLPISQTTQTPGASVDTLPPVTFPVEYQPQTIPQNIPAVKTNESGVNPGSTVLPASSTTPFLPPPAAMPTQTEPLPKAVAPNQTSPEPGAQTPSAFPQFNGLPGPVSKNHPERIQTSEEVETSSVFFSHSMIIRGQASASVPLDDTKSGSVPKIRSENNAPVSAAEAGADLFDLPAAAPATVTKASESKTETAPEPQTNQDRISSPYVFSERVGGRPLPLKIDPKLETTWKSLSDPLRTKAESAEGIAQSSRILSGVGPDGQIVSSPGNVPPYAASKRVCPKYGREGKSIPGYAPYEYIMDGSDSKGEAYATPDWNVHHLDQEDTIAHFDTVDGQILVEPSNRVCIYSPRFGSVRQIIGLRENDQNLLLHKAETTVGTASSRKLAAVDVRFQDERTKHTLGETRLSGMMAKDLGHIVSGEVTVMENEQEIYLGDMTALIRYNVMTDEVKASLAKGLQAAQNWGSMEQVKVAIGEVFATANIYANGPSTLYHVENGTKSSKLRLIKIASKDAAQPGELIEFVLRYENVGDQVIGNVTLLDNLSSRLQYVDRSAKSSRKGEFLVNENKQGSVVLRWEITEPLKPGEFGIVEFICKVL